MSAPVEEHRALGLDIGARRIGVALSDAHGMLAGPLTTINAVPRERAITQIANLVREHVVNQLVVGLPLTLRGEVGPQATLVKEFAAALEVAIGLPVALFDERLTTAAAEQMLRDSGLKPAKIRERVDQVAAAIILQDYLDARRNTM